MFLYGYLPVDSIFRANLTITFLDTTFLADCIKATGDSKIDKHFKAPFNV